MPFKRKYVKRRPGKKGFRKAVMKIVEKQIETKHKDGVWNGVAISTVPVSNSLVNINQGVAQNMRVGNQIKLTSIKGDFFVVLNPNVDYHNVRLIIYMKKDVSGPDMTIQYYEQPDYDSYTILKDTLLPLSKFGETTKQYRFWKKMNCRVDYDGTLGTTCTNNEVLFFFTSDTTLNPPTMYGTIKTFYKDG